MVPLQQCPLSDFDKVTVWSFSKHAYSRCSKETATVANAAITVVFC